MKRQEFLLNLTLVVVIGALGYQMYDAQQNPPEAPVAIADPTRPKEEVADEEAAETESTYNAEEATKKFPKLGSNDLFAAIITPTPTPPPPTPTPAPTPDINSALATWRVLSVDRGEVLVEDVKLSQIGSDEAIWEMKVGNTKAVDIGNGTVKTATLKSTDESNEMELPSATFTLEGTTIEKVMRMGDEPAAGGGAPAKPAGQPGPPRN